MTYIWAVIHIILESFPISSSGHIILLERWYPHVITIAKPLREYVEYIVHIPTAIVVMLYFFKQWSFPFAHMNRCWLLIIKIGSLTALSCTVTVGTYFLLQPYTRYVPLWLGFSITALSLFSLRWCYISPVSSWTIHTAFVLGVVQGIACIPGISRLATTYVAARWFGITGRRALHISFLIQWPLLIGAGLYSFWVLYPIKKELLSLEDVWVMLGAGLCAYAGIYLIDVMARNQTIWWWSVYLVLPLVISFIGSNACIL